MGKAYTSGAFSTVDNSGVNAGSVVNLIGQGLSFVDEDTVQMADDAKVVGGDNVEMGGSIIKTQGDYLKENSVKVGDNSTYYQTAMDERTQQIIDQAITMAGANANNMMVLAAGRDPDKPLADESVEIEATGDAVNTSLSGLSGLFSPVRIGALVAVLILFFMIRRKKKGRK